jgi:hypothetical protein
LVGDVRCLVGTLDISPHIWPEEGFASDEMHVVKAQAEYSILNHLSTLELTVNLDLGGWTLVAAVCVYQLLFWVVKLGINASGDLVKGQLSAVLGT